MAFLVVGLSDAGGAAVAGAGAGDARWPGGTPWCAADFPTFDVTGSAATAEGRAATLGTGGDTETAGLGTTFGAVSAGGATGGVSTGDTVAAGAAGVGADLRKK